jgi:hypothetical protein
MSTDDIGDDAFHQLKRRRLAEMERRRKSDLVRFLTDNSVDQWSAPELSFFGGQPRFLTFPAELSNFSTKQTGPCRQLWKSLC